MDDWARNQTKAAAWEDLAAPLTVPPKSIEEAYGGLVALFKEQPAASAAAKPEPATTADMSASQCPDELLVKAMEEGKVDSRGALGMRFDRFLASNPAAREQHKETRSLALKAQFRLNWAKAQYDLMVQEKTKVEQKTHADFARGNYEPFAIVLKHEGGKVRGASL